AMTASRTLRVHERSAVRNSFLTSCCVSVDPPCMPSLRRFTTMARAMPTGFTPGCSQNDRSSAATSASGTIGATWSSGTGVRRSPADSTASSAPLASNSTDDDSWGGSDGRSTVANSQPNQIATITSATPAASSGHRPHSQALVRQPRESPPPAPPAGGVGAPGRWWGPEAGGPDGGRPGGATGRAGYGSGG